MNPLEPYSQFLPLHKHQGAVQTWRVNQGKEKRVLKEISLGKLKDWKQLDLFEREIQALQHLNHPQIPKLLDHFEKENEMGYHLCLVHEWVEGQALDDKLAKGWHPTWPEIIDIAKQSLDILSYLHGLSPPVLHRDIKPSNLILDPEGTLHLIDFGAVQLALAPQGGSTVVGTFGYMAPELFSGQAQPSSDLYALGMSLIHLLTRKEPQDLLDENLKLEWKKELNLSLKWLNWLDQMVDPIAELRFQSAQEALSQMPELNQSWTAQDLDLEEDDFTDLRKFLLNASYTHTLDKNKSVVILKRTNSSGLSFGLSLAVSIASSFAIPTLLSVFQVINTGGFISPALRPMIMASWGIILSLFYLSLYGHSIFRLLALSHYKEFYFDGQSLEIHERRTGNWKRRIAIPAHQMETLSLHRHYGSWRIEVLRPNQTPFVIETLFFKKEAHTLHKLFSKMLLPETNLPQNTTTQQDDDNLKSRGTKS